MKTCENCYWCDQCPDTGGRCEYYDPVEGGESVIIREYLQNLEERQEEYKELIKEQQGEY